MPPSSPAAAPTPYRGRFAPSPTGALHAGSIAAALASWLDARAHGGQWLLRMEDIDPPREVPGAAQAIIDVLAACGMTSDAPVLLQSSREAAYAAALDRLAQRGAVYPCACSRTEIDQAALAQGLPPGVYPGTCRHGLGGRPARAWRLRVPAGEVAFEDRAAGRLAQDVAREVGDFVVRRADGPWAYQLAVVVDDAAQGITHVVRGADLLDNTPRQIVLQRALGLAAPRYLHVPVVVNAQGEKLSKQTGATAIAADDALGALERAARHLGLPPIGGANVAAFLRAATRAWAGRWDEPPAISGRPPPRSPRPR
jgi:glutamyl-Q tRNA(Asp) synthetase